MLILGLMLLVAAPAGESVADRITLRDGSTVLGLVTSTTSGGRGSVEFLVSRDWAERNAPAQLANWERAAASASRRAIEQRRERLADWRRERAQSPGVGDDDRILRWLDAEQARLADPDAAARAPLVPVRLPRQEVRDLDRHPVASNRLLRLAWSAGIRQPEASTMGELAGAVEARGLLFNPKKPGPAVPLDRLLPPSPETEAVWLARRAATEIAIDPGLRFLRYQDNVFPDPGPGGQAPAPDPTMAMSEVARLLDPDGNRSRPDPMAPRLQAVARRGRIGAAVTALTIAPDLAGVTVASTFWVRAPRGQWVIYGSRQSTVRVDDLGDDDGGDLAADPQVKAAFGLVESLGLGAIPPALKDRSLRIGAATRKALGDARSQLNQDLDALMLPVLDPVPENVATPRKPVDAPKPEPAPRRSMLGPKGR